MKDFLKHPIEQRIVKSDKLGPLVSGGVPGEWGVTMPINSEACQFDVCLVYRNANLWSRSAAFSLPTPNIERTNNAQTHLLS